MGAEAGEVLPPDTGREVPGTAGLIGLAGTKSFVPYDGNPVIRPGAEGQWDAGALGSMSVIKVGNTLHLYYEAWGVRTAKGSEVEEYNTLQIGHATSADGIHWIKDPANPVIAKGTEEDAWDRDGTWDPFVIHENGIFKMWYGGGNKECDWGYAESRDGTNFTKKARISKLGGVEDDHVIHDKSSGRYFMYYWDRRHEPTGLFRAASVNETAFDFGAALPLRIEGEDPSGMYKFTHVFRDNDKWFMLYGDFKRPHCPQSTIRLASSPDGLRWTRFSKGLLDGHDGEIIALGEDLYAIYHGPRNHFDAAACDIRVALFHGKLDSLAEEPAK